MKIKRIYLPRILVLAIACLGLSITFKTNVNAYVGQVLSEPEDGWTRFDDYDRLIKYNNVSQESFGGWDRHKTNNQNFYNGTITYSYGDGDNYEFTVYGSEFRIITEVIALGREVPEDYKGIQDTDEVYIDNNDVGGIKERKGGVFDSFGVVVFEYKFKDIGVHHVKVVKKETNYSGASVLDCIDVKGKLVNKDFNPQDELPYINDQNLKKVICETLNKKSNDTITKEDLEKITRLDAAQKGIKSLIGLEYCTNLKAINFSDNEISDLTPLSNLSNLEWLNVPNNKVSDLSPLKNLSNLKVLFLYNSQISDLSPLKNLINLEALSVADSKVTDISVISNLVNLKSLYLNNNKITDISSLAKLTELEKLGLAQNKIRDISVVKNLTKLNEFDAYYNNLSDISAVSSLTNLTYLSLGNNDITDITSLSKLNKLKTLYLYGCKIKDFSPVKDLNITDLKIDNQLV